MTGLLRTMTWLALAGLVATGSRVSAQVREWPSERPPKPLPARPSSFPPYAIRTLPNGLQVVVVRHSEQPIISAQMLIKAGAAYDPPEKTGVAGMVASLLNQGTTLRTAGAIADAVDTAGAEFSVLSGTDATFVQITTMKDGFSFGLDLLSEALRTPGFAGEELERQRQQLRSGLRVSYEDPDYIASAVFERLVFGSHPYGLPSDGTPESVARITRDDLVAYHRQYYVPGNSILAIVGDVGEDEAFAAAERVFGSWERRETPVPTFNLPPEPRRRVILVDMPNTVQTEIRVGHTGIPRKSPEFLALDLGVRVLGGEGGNRLQHVLRTTRGLTYGASASLDAYRLGGIIRAETDTRPEAAGEALRVMVEEFFKIQREVIDDLELANAKAYAAGSFPLGLETPGSISTKVLNSLFHELPLKELESYREMVTTLTPAQVQGAMRGFLHPDRLSIVVVGRAAFLTTLLKNVGFKDVEVVPIEELDLTAASLRRPAPAVVRAAKGAAVAGMPLASKAEWETAKVLLERAAQAAGGLPVLRAVKTMSATAETVLFTPMGSIRATTKTLVAYPDRIRVDAATPEGALVQAYDAGHAWIWEKRGPRDAPEAMRRQFDLGVRRDWIRLMVDALDERLTGRRVGDETALGGRLLHVAELWAEDLPPVRVAVDAETGRLDRLSYQVPGPVGLETMTETFSDFRLVSSVLVPFKAVTRRDNAPVLERTVTELKINPVLQPGVFEKPR